MALDRSGCGGYPDPHASSWEGEDHRGSLHWKARVAAKEACAYPEVARGETSEVEGRCQWETVLDLEGASRDHAASSVEDEEAAGLRSNSQAESQHEGVILEVLGSAGFHTIGGHPDASLGLGESREG
jgi:hypothetical protein